MDDAQYVSLEAPDGGGEAALQAAVGALKQAAEAPPAPEPDPAPAEAAPAAPVPPPGLPGPDDDEADEAAPAGKTVPYQALREAREHLKTLKSQVAEMEQLRARAAQADAMLPVVEQWRPVIEAIQRDPSLMERATQPRTDPYEAGITEQDATEYAREIQLYTPEGKLDTVTAKRALARQNKMASAAAEAAATRAVQPVLRESAAVKAQQTYQWVVQSAAAEGDPVDPAAVANLMKHLPAELVAQNPEGIGTLVKLVARGQSPRKAAPAPPPPPVVPTEAPGSRTPGVSALTDLDRRFAREMDGGTKKYAAQAARFKPGELNVLED